MVCNSSDLADWKNLASSSDVAILAALGHREKIRIVERLSEGDAKQKQLTEDLGLSSGTLSRWLGELVRARIICQDRDGSHDPYRLVKPERTNELLDTAALLASELANASAVRAAHQAKVDEIRLRERNDRKT
jgi:DNA-binding transcriptional ArsR family regulator